MKKTLEQFKNMSKKNKIILASLLMAIVFACGAAAYAYIAVNPSESSQPLSVQTGKLILEFNDVGDTGNITGEMGIGDTITKDMVITNQGSEDATATIMWNELVNTYLEESLTYKVTQTIEYNKDENVEKNTLEYNIDVPQVRPTVPRSEEPIISSLTRELIIPAGKKIYYRVAITFENLEDVDQTADLSAQFSTSFTILEKEELDPFILTFDDLDLIGFTESTENLEIPDKVRDENGVWRRITQIGEYAFYEYSNLKSVIIPDGVTSIGEGAFGECINLASITIPDSVTDIGAFAFENCGGLTSFNISANVTNIGEVPFCNCKNLTTINVDENNPNYKSIDGVLFTKDEKTLISFPGGKTGSYVISDSITNIGSYLFYGCSNLTSITISDSVTSIGEGAFMDCSGLTTIIIPDSVTNIEMFAFSGCRSLTSVAIGIGITVMESSLFSDCINLTSVVIPDNITELSPSVFENCSALTTVTIGSGLKNRSYNSDEYLYSTIFKGCTSLTAINVSENNTIFKSIDGVLFTKDGTKMIRYPQAKSTTYTIPDGVTSIEGWTFYGCSNVTSVTLPNTLTIIKSAAFWECTGLTSITIPDSVKSIEDNAFRECSNLTSVIYKSRTYTSKSTFANIFNAYSGNTTSVYAFYNTGLSV